ncbi:GNAT family N-acetyltransferase [Natronobacterium gregoryi]|uniref:Acetyltransferase, ribosomal protein N-acetylase n=2 Tax=Natronobacterium gregoryi TaxID=44930 RepID=L0AI55_NATGS|nr:GNAT family protein [Natronobacterium gregoryi]AFZ72852.1 acetyltransferase, ribosomal protein N-acetylase [Natronobacterium gregoryi SP2]ELY69660.1 N-acetyltransferase GCN5 [Natronobacterium gregoryi SP2]PLK21919.1 N-acetyltransferase [Natronobacterium gregoryi SP2]SFI65754.1 Protein N-acetyltransferase, RimJ/RimL family [Natronobacterium gregoryi]
MPDSTFLPGDAVDLRPIEEDDLEFFRDAINDPQVWRPIGGSRPLNLEQEREYFEDVVCSDDGVQLLIVADGSPVGTIGLHDIDWEADSAEIGYWLEPDAHDQGYGTEAAALLVGYGFDQLGLHRIRAHVFEFNDASQRLLESIGFIREGTKRESQFIDGEYQDTYWYGLLEEEWREGT